MCGASASRNDCAVSPPEEDGCAEQEIAGGAEREIAGGTEEEIAGGAARRGNIVVGALAQCVRIGQ
ncbi:hypothetical protein RQCS_39090 [Rhodococcus qingshengii]|jgi:hypothetical protein|nr:hypothetical protein RE2895_39870 [Rhodococcus erythropolis]BCF84364.1 hypothetical protein RQCS_39090 [Rhodococcus qingshengii]